MSSQKLYGLWSVRPRGQIVPSLAAQPQMVGPQATIDAGESDVIGLVVISALAAVLSLLITGFVYGFSNNLFHLAIIGRLYDEPQFRNDAYMQSLHFYAAGPLRLLQGADRYIDPAQLFLGLAYFSRMLSFIGFLACGRLLGVTSRRERLLVAAMLAATSLLRGGSFAGGNGLFINYFTHSEFANGLSLLTIYYAARGRLATAFAVNGVTFFTNAFIGVWNAIPLGLIIGWLIFQRRISLGQILARGGIGLALFLVLASPVIANVLSNPEFGQPLPFDYRIYLAEYWPFHFLFGWNPRPGMVGLAVVSVAGPLAFVTLARRRHAACATVFVAALAGYMTVYAAGIAAPVLTGSAAILNLHLLRAGGPIQLLAALGTVVLAATWLTSDNPRERRFFGPLLVIALCSLKVALLLAPPVLLGALSTRLAQHMPARLLNPSLSRLALIVVLLALPYTIWLNQRTDADVRNRVRQWSDVGRWARENTPPDAVFLIPTQSFVMHENPERHVPAVAEELWIGSEVFDYTSHRRVWTDFKRGAAVMWSPSYYAIWHQRLGEVVALSSLDQERQYAAGHNVGYVVDSCIQRDGKPALFRTAQLCVFAATE